MAIALSAINTGVIITLLFLSTGISIILGGIAWSRIVSLFLPFPIALGALSTLYPMLPFLSAFLANLIASRFQRNNDLRKNRIMPVSSDETTVNNNGATTEITTDTSPASPRTLVSLFLYPFVTSTIDHLLTLLPTVIATLASTYVAPSDNNCHLEQTWQSYYHNKDVNAIRTIQDQLQCCGLRSTRDRAWPFKDSTRGDTACENTTGYQRSCLQPWSEQERRVAVLVLVAAVIGWGIKMGTGYLNSRYFYPGSRRNAWLNGIHARNNARSEPIGPRLLPYTDNAYENTPPGDEEVVSDDELPLGTGPLINPDSRDSTSPEGDLAGAGPWRENV